MTRDDLYRVRLDSRTWLGLLPGSLVRSKKLARKLLSKREADMLAVFYKGQVEHCVGSLL